MNAAQVSELFAILENTFWSDPPPPMDKRVLTAGFRICGAPVNWGSLVWSPAAMLSPNVVGSGKRNA